jgi:hypothetical protein
MQLEGVIVNGRVELDEPAELPEGTRVRVEAIPVEPTTEKKPAEGTVPEKPLTSLNRLLLSLAGTAKGLPPDMAEQHDHYIHGTKKR